MKINWNPNPFKTTIDIDDRDKEFFLMHIQNEMYSDLLCSLDNDMKYYNEKSLSNIHSRVEKWQQICDMSIDHIDVQRELSYLNEDHCGDCICVPCSCGRCMVESRLGIDTLAGLGTHEASKILDSFEKALDINSAIAYLENDKLYEKPDTWPDTVGWDVHIPRWEQERKNALRWLIDYKNKHGF